MRNFKAEQRIGKIGLQPDQAGADKEQQEPPEKQAMGGSGSDNPRHAHLAKHLAERVREPPRQIIKALQGPPQTIDLDPLPGTPGEHAESCQHQKVHGDKGPRTMTDVPVNFSSEFHKLFRS